MSRSPNTLLRTTTLSWVGHAASMLRILLLSLVLFPLVSCKPKPKDEFIQLTNTGKNYYDKGQPDKAVAALEQALALQPSHPDAHLNLACAYLLANQPEKALPH